MLPRAEAEERPALMGFLSVRFSRGLQARELSRPGQGIADIAIKNGRFFP